MWFVFQQLAGLGRSDMTRFYALAGLDEARRYLAHPLLGPPLVRCTELAVAVERRTAQDIFGSPDDLKFRSSMTLFMQPKGAPTVFAAALDKYFAAEPEQATLALLG